MRLPFTGIGPVAVALAAALGWPQPSGGQQATRGVVVLAPVTTAEGAPASAPGPNGDPHPVVHAAPPSTLVRQVEAVLGEPYPRQVLRLHRWAKDLALHDARRAGAPTADHRQALEAPAYVLLSEEDGGFARAGFWLETRPGTRRFSPAGYVVMVADSAGLASGDFEETFAHELAHLTVRVLLDSLPAGMSRTPHMSMAVTDYPTAFDEGYAEHFQPLVRDRTTTPGLRAADRGTAAPDYTALWLSNVDRALRSDGVRRNLFVHDKPLPPEAHEARPDRYRLFLASTTNSAAARQTIKNGQQMIASEGVVATLLYRIVTDTRLQQRYRDAAFYRPFLRSAGSAPAGRAPARAVTPYENVNLKLFAAMRAMTRTPLSADRPLALDLVRSYGALFPDERAALYDVVVRTTYGATVARDAAAVYERQARTGAVGAMESFVASLPEARRRLRQWTDDAVAGRLALDAALGPELWVLDSSFTIASAPWSDDRTLPFALNLNAASVPELMALPGVDLALATRIAAARAERGWFRDVDELRGVEGVPGSLVGTLGVMHRQAQASGGYRRP